MSSTIQNMNAIKIQNLMEFIEIYQSHGRTDKEILEQIRMFCKGEKVFCSLETSILQDGELKFRLVPRWENEE